MRHLRNSVLTGDLHLTRWAIAKRLVRLHFTTSLRLSSFPQNSLSDIATLYRQIVYFFSSIAMPPRYQSPDSLDFDCPEFADSDVKPVSPIQLSSEAPIPTEGVDNLPFHNDDSDEGPSVPITLD